MIVIFFNLFSTPIKEFALVELFITSLEHQNAGHHNNLAYFNAFNSLAIF